MKQKPVKRYEADMYAPIRDYFVGQGYEVFGEVNHLRFDSDQGRRADYRLLQHNEQQKRADPSATVSEWAALFVSAPRHDAKTLTAQPTQRPFSRPARVQPQYPGGTGSWRFCAHG